MKYKKYSYIIVLILILIVGINRTYAANTKTCYYINPDKTTKELKVVAEMHWGAAAVEGNNLKNGSSITVNKFNQKLSTDTVSMLNWGSDYKTGSNKGTWFFGAEWGGSTDCTTSGTCFGYYHTMDEISKLSNITCPRYVVIEFNTSGTDEFFAWGTDSETLAKQAAGSDQSNASYAYGSNYTTINGQKIQITEDIYYSTFVITGSGTIDKTELKCEDIFTDDIKAMLDEVLQIVRIAVPILIIVLGMVDFAKAVIASKEDAMKKAQITFIKRLIIGVAVFFVPVLIDIVMELANIVWEGMGYTQCNFK